MNFKYKGEDVIVEFDDNGNVKWVYAYNMRMAFNVLPDDLKLEVTYFTKVCIVCRTH